MIAVLLAGVALGFYLRTHLSQRPAAAKVLTIVSRGQNYQITTEARTVGEVLAEQNFDLDRNKITLSPDSAVQSGMVVEVNRSITINIRDGGAAAEVVTSALTVGDLLYERKIALAATDRLDPSPESFLGEGMVLTIDRIVDLEVVETERIPYALTLQHDPAAYYGQEAVTHRGVDGQREKTFLITYKNGVEIARVLLSQRVIAAAQQEIRSFGTKIEVIEAVEGRASWYAYKDCMCAAHPFYEKGRFVRVTAVNSGKSVIVKINDRGPDRTIHPDRIIDLDATAYRELAPLGSGTIAVRTELLR